MPDKNLVEYFIAQTNERFQAVQKKVDWLTGIVLVMAVIMVLDSKLAAKVFEIGVAIAGGK